MVVLAIFSETNTEMDGCLLCIQVVHAAILPRNVVSAPSRFGCRAEMRYTIDMEQDDSEEEKAIQELESSRDDEDSEELWACSE